MAATDHSRSEAAKQRRQDQLQRWLGSETDQTGSESREISSGSGTRRAKVRFAQGAVFMAACSAGDREEVAALLRQGADINHANVDGLTALHQACIDENAEMVQFLVENGSDVNRGDNEGWTPLHAAASCGFIQIAKYLIEHSAHVGAVNSEGELPLDVATEDAMERLLKAEIKKQGIDVDTARKEEERIMLRDAMAVLAGDGTLTPHPNTKATALHVAAAKGYIEVLKVLLQCRVDVDCSDTDGWTPLHAAAHWGQEEVCSLLVDNMCDMGAVNNVGQTPLDVADENLVDVLEELQKKQNALRSEKEKQTPVIEPISHIPMVPVRPRRTSISRMSSKEKICLHEREKHPPPPALQSSPAEDEEEEGQAGQNQSQGQAKASSSSSSEEESESESDAESEKAKKREIINNLNNKRNTTNLLPTSMSTSTTASQVKRELSKPPVTEAPGSWRTSLRKADSSVTLGSAGLSDPSQDTSRPPESGLGMSRSASSPRLSSEADTKEPRLARVPPNPTRRLFSIPDNTADNSNSWLSRSSSYTRRFNSQSGNDLTSSTPSLLHSSSYGKRLDDPTVTSASTGTSSAGLGRLNSVLAQRLPQEQTEKKDQPAITTSNSQSTTAGEQEAKQRRKSYLTPVRDEEAEAQRKARSRHARQSRRSTQGVTLTDLQEAEKTIQTMKTDNKGREKEEEKEKEAKQKKGEEGGMLCLQELSWRSRIASLQKSDLLGLTQPAGTPRPQTSDRRDVEANTGESETERWARERNERRQIQARRKAQRTGEGEDNDPSGEEEFSTSGLNSQTDQRLSSRSDSSYSDRTRGGGSETKDFKKLFEEVSRQNSQLQSQLQDTQRSVTQTRLDLEKATQRQERLTDCSALLERERKDRRMLERRMAELEEELKVLVDLKADNQRLKDENGALIRVISKLSK
ncbi:protein phosphatase 1 regulatory subunit 12A isoform X2 [Maylandia zebra]|uniref:protein phosphatase 1 regulatory subunit 12A isoform X2 n=1 Tax=Maylandia zebra TaxID=106582 RepID=UPI000648B73C|nr:protein phosphatase 1 regulatory subunit 12A isoform X2 [Maylandia zebra]XP_026031513.1 protein phosphatase 1 regulatory subunit 12A-like isoform X2 [Astatotilapia calliptera]